MKKILYLSFYFEPDLCAGSFRNSPLAKELSAQLGERGEMDVISTMPNRYNSYDVTAPALEQKGNMTIHRVSIPTHKSGYKDQMISFKTFFTKSKKLVKNKKYDLVFASSSRLFTAYLGYIIAKKQGVPLYLDMRDIFVDTINDILKNPLVKKSIVPILKYIEKKIFNYATHINLISAGFKPYFEQYQKPQYSFFTNGIDPEFLSLKASAKSSNERIIITYAGNIGEGQGLHKIIPIAAQELAEKYTFLIIGDGGAKKKLLNEINRYKVKNIEIKKPVNRKELIEIYNRSDFLFMHLNDYDALKKVLPSKLFELAAFDKPIIAGVAGYAYKFIADNISNSILFPPGDVDEMVKQLNNYIYHNEFRLQFLDNFKRDTINQKMASSILSYL